jgi:RNA polymerase sigma-70 factor, ECF subfamily
MLSLLFRRAKYKGNTDEELLILFKTSLDNRIIGELYERYSHLVFGVCLNILPSRELAEDTVMHIFELLPERILRHDIAFFKSWLYRVTQNECYMHLRKGKKEFNAIDINQTPAQDNEEEQHFYLEVKIEALEKAIDQLKGEQKKAVQLFYLEELSYKEISDRENWDLKKVKSLIQNAKRNLKLILEKEYANQFVS